MIRRVVCNIRELAQSKETYKDLCGFYFILSIVLVPIFYTFVIYPFYYDESLYQWFVFENTVFFLIVTLWVSFLNSCASIRFQRIELWKFNSYQTFYVIILSLTGIVSAYLVLNIIKLGFFGFYNGCHYCGPEPVLGFGVLRVLLFDIGVVLAILLPVSVFVFGFRSFLFLFHAAVSLFLLYYFFVGSYRNQILPVVFCYLVIWLYKRNNAKLYYFIFMLLAPVAAISMAFFHYFGGDSNPTYTLYEYFGKNEFFSNYNNFIIYNSGFELEQPFSGASYIGPMLHRLSSFIDTGFESSAGQMADFMGTGIGYGFSPLLEALLNFGDYYFIGAVILGSLLYIFRLFLMNIDNQLMACCFYGLILFYVFNMCRVDFTAAFNIFFHKALILVVILALVDFKKVKYSG
ncbi:hypothetical protein ABXV24_11615 [Vibrio owensii]|uniref:hypothetical protein n=1 Tax=Vibrio owensii TaxID=696485 RepID=UPI00339A7B9C